MMPGSAAALDRESWRGGVLRVLERGSSRDADVLLVQMGDTRVVVKDFAPRSWLVRNTIGRLLTAREVRAYRALEGHPAVPRLVGRIDALAFAVEYRPGRRVSRRVVKRSPAQFMSDLERAVREIHARGVVHLDLRHRGNVLAGEAGDPILIDFASALCFKPRGLGWRWLRPWLARFDLAALAKWAAEEAQPPAARSGGATSDAGRGASRPT